MNPGKKYRHEYKYPISDLEATVLKQRLNGVMPLDAHVGPSGMYLISSLYFDDYYNSCFYDNENGTDPREKFRIRIYNHSSSRISLVGVALITAAIIITIQTSIVVSLGMVGALSIVRFRTAIKDPLDLMFLFWSISTGIICGAGFAEYAVVLAVVLTVVVVVLDWLPIAKAPMILIVNADNIDLENEIVGVVKEYSKHYTVKSRNASASSLDMTIEIATKDVSSLIKKMSGVEGVNGVSALAHDGEVTF